MRRMPLITPAIMSLMAGAITSPSLDLFLSSSKGGKPRTPSKKYPFSNTRQNARYARQIAAGQIKLERVNHG